MGHWWPSEERGWSLAALQWCSCLELSDSTTRTEVAWRSAVDAMMDGLRRIFEHVANLRESGRLVVRPMGDLVPARDLEACEREAMFVA